MSNMLPTHSLGVAIASNRLKEKHEMQDLNNRLSSYIRTIRDLKSAGNNMDSVMFVDTINLLEQELVHLKKLYDSQLESNRIDIDDINRAKTHASIDASKTKEIANELQNRLQQATQEVNKQNVDINSLQRTIIQKDQDYAELKQSVQRPLNDLTTIQRQYEELLRDNADLKHKYEAEQTQRLETEDRNHQLTEKSTFQDRVHTQQMQDMNDRLQTASSTILLLESKLREMTQADNALQEMLERVRDASKAELKRYQEESEEVFHRNMTEMQSQLNATHKKLDDTNKVNIELNLHVTELVNRIHALEGEVSSLEHQKSCVQQMMRNERVKGQDHMQLLERKLRELQDMLFSKMRELNAAREAQVPLKAELEAFKAMLEEEEKRLRIPPTVAFEMPPPPSPTQAFTNQSSDAIVNSAKMAVNAATTMTAGLPPLKQALDYDLGGSTAGPLGPIRARSAPGPVARQNVNLVHTSLGQGQDYFDQMFNDLKVSKKPHDHSPKMPTPPRNSPPMVDSDPYRPQSTPVTHDYTTSTSSATGNIKILEVHPEGKYIRLINTHRDCDAEIGNFMMQQNVGGHPVSVYRFQPRMRIPSNGTVTVWSGSNDPMLHQPPTDFICKEQERWGTGPECTTIVCKGNGQAIAWTTAAHRFSDEPYLEATSGQAEMAEEQELPEYDMNLNAQRHDAVYLRREKESPPCLNPPKHPHGSPPPNTVHPASGQSRPLTYGNDNSSVNRQSRVQSTRPDPIPGAPYAGAAGQRMGSAGLRKFNSGALSNKSLHSVNVRN